MIEILGLALALAGIAISLWQTKRAKKAETQLNDVLNDLPRQMANQLGRIESPGSETGLAAPNAQGTTAGPSGNSLFVTSYADVDGDGRDELLVEHPAGVHGAGLQVFGWRDFEFVRIGQLATGHASGFEVLDFDNDGRLEIGAVETDWNQDEPYVTAPMLKVWYRWNGQEFAEVQRTRFLPEF